MADFPVALTNAQDGSPPTGTEILAKHLNNLEAKVGIDGSAIATSLDYLLKNAASINPGHKHTSSALLDANGALLLAAGGTNQNVTLTPSGTGKVVLNGQVGVNTTPTMDFEVLCTAGLNPNMQFVVEGDYYRFAGIVYSSVAAANAPIFNLRRARNTIATPNTVLSGDCLGGFTFIGYSELYSSHWNASAKVNGYADGEWDTAGDTTDAPGRLEISTSPDGTLNAVIRLVVNNQGNIGLNVTSWGTSAAKVVGVGSGTAPTSQPADMFQMWSQDIVAGNAAPHFLTENGSTIKLYKEAALTTKLTQITHTEPGTPDYAIADFTQTSPWGYASQDEGRTHLKVTKNLQVRLDELEARLQAHGLLT